MFDISWTEFVLIGIVALIVIGPKELPGVMRSLGQWTRKIRGMAAEFQGQFQEAMREAEMTDLKKEVDDLAREIKQYDPLKSVREDVESIGRNLETPPAVAPATDLSIADAVSELKDQSVAAAAIGPVAPEAIALSAPTGDTAAATPGPDAGVGTAAGPVVPEAATEPAAPAPPEPTG